MITKLKQCPILRHSNARMGWRAQSTPQPVQKPKLGSLDFSITLIPVRHMLAGAVLALALSAASAASAASDRICTQPENIESAELGIDKPGRDEQLSGVRHLVRGHTSMQDGTIAVLVHPLSTRLWWVQPEPGFADSDGLWQTLVYLGTPTEGSGELFEIVAIMPKRCLEPGQTFDRLSDHYVRSNRVTVERTD